MARPQDTTTSPGSRAFGQLLVNAIYDAVYNRVENYDEDSVALLCHLVMTANFWDPTT